MCIGCKRTLPNPDEHWSLLQNRSSPDVQVSSQATPTLVSRFHHKRGLYAYGHSPLETLPSSSGDPTGTKYYPHNGITVLHIGYLALDNLSKDQQPASWFHCRIAWLELGPHDLLCREAGPLQSGLVSTDVCCQSGIQLAIHGREYDIESRFSQC
jgi:hypothetical protein